MRHIIRVFSLLSLAALFFACSQTPGSAPAEPQLESTTQGISTDRADIAAQEFEFEITIENLTPATGPGASQPFAPPLLATHTPLYHIFRLGKFASDELAQIAQDAVSGPMVDMLNESDFVYDVAQGDGVVFPGSSTTIRIKARPGFHKLSIVSMLVNTNDAFTGVDGLRLPAFGTKVYYMHTYDAGSEKNTELKGHIPGPCCGTPFEGIPTHERIHFHKGITGVGDLSPDMYGWDEPSAKITIRRVN